MVIDWASTPQNLYKIPSITDRTSHNVKLESIVFFLPQKSAT